jgi:hypothetical protein
MITWGAAVALRKSDGKLIIDKPKDPGFAPQPGQPFKKSIITLLKSSVGCITFSLQLH